MKFMSFGGDFSEYIRTLGNALVLELFFCVENQILLLFYKIQRLRYQHLLKFEG